jgi:hypothetical protein
MAGRCREWFARDEYEDVDANGIQHRRMACVTDATTVLGAPQSQGVIKQVKPFISALSLLDRIDASRKLGIGIASFGFKGAAKALLLTWIVYRRSWFELRHEDQALPPRSLVVFLTMELTKTTSENQSEISRGRLLPGPSHLVAQNSVASRLVLTYEADRKAVNKQIRAFPSLAQKTPHP